MRTLRRTSLAAMAALLLAAAGCGEDSTGPADGPGVIEGTVTLSAGRTLVNPRLEVYTDFQNLQAETEQFTTPMNGGPSTYSFRLEGVAPGLYLMSVCGSVGALTRCEAISTDGVRIREFEVRAGETLSLNIRI